MASKASMLKNGANKASSGLFAGMTPLSKEQDKKSAVKAENKPEKKVEEKQPEKKPVEKAPVVEETVQEPVKEVVKEVVETPVVAEPQTVMPQPQSYVPQTPVNQYSQAPVQQYQNVPVQTPVYNQPVNNYQQPVIMAQNPMPAYTEVEKVPAQSKQEKSRYEKEKFLLLDIRGYRDYVEHMAKASNMSATKYIRSLIDEDMKRNMDIYMAHKQLEETLKGRR